MKILRTKPLPEEAPHAAFAAEPAPPVETLLVFVGEGGAFGRWVRLGPGGVEAEGGAEDGLPASHPEKTALAVPGTQVSIHWLDLPADLAPAQAAAAARLEMADRIAQPMSEMHVAAGRQEQGLTCIAVTPLERMAEWLAASASRGLDPGLIVPAPLLLPVPEHKLARRDGGGVSDYRGPALAFSLEPDPAAALARGRPIEDVDEDAFDAYLGAALSSPVLNLRQGAFARRKRRLAIERDRIRRLVLLALALLLASFAIEIATLLRYTFAADRLEAEAEIARMGGGDARLAALRGAGAGFAATASAVFSAVEATPNVELVSLNYMPDGALQATVQADVPATLDAFRQRIEASGFRVEMSGTDGAGGGLASELTVRPL